jgi:mono/diheme cytochrome c family protein
MEPTPRDFTTGQYKFHSTPMGTPATEEDLYRTITHGMRGTSMPGWSGLSSGDRWQLVYYLRSLSRRFDAPSRAEPIAIPSPPPSTPARVARGAAVFTKYGCASCHGVDGRGDGPAAAGLVDVYGDPVFPADMSRGWRFKGGASPVDIFRTVSTGIEGTPMVGYAFLIGEDDRWALVHYVRSLFADADEQLP